MKAKGTPKDPGQTPITSDEVLKRPVSWGLVVTILAPLGGVFLLLLDIRASLARLDTWREDHLKGHEGATVQGPHAALTAAAVAGDPFHDRKSLEKYRRWACGDAGACVVAIDPHGNLMAIPMPMGADAGADDASDAGTTDAGASRDAATE